MRANEFIINEATVAPATTNVITKKGGSKAGLIAIPAIAAIEIYDAWEKITALPANMNPAERKLAVKEIIGRQVARFGLTLVAAEIGALLAGVIAAPTVVGTIPAAIAGAAAGIGLSIGADFVLGDSVDAIADAVIKYVFK